MKGAKFSSALLLFFLLIPFTFAQLRVGFYSRSCPRAETIVRNVMQQRFRGDRTVAAALLRMQFHDCFVRGCDASILIDSTPTHQAEKSAGPNLTVRDFDVIDEIKTQLEAECPSTVSCADIIVLATRDVVALAGGPSFTVPTGRRDGLVSNAVDVNLPGPTIPVNAAISVFKAKGLNTFDTVALLGGHTVGVAHCSLFQDRLSNFQGSGQPDPSMNPALVTSLRQTCAAPNNPTAALDQGTPLVFDNRFFKEIRAHKGVLQLDQRISSDRATRGLVAVFAANNARFKRQFAKSMVKMGKIEVLTGKAGEIRKNCRRFN